MRVLEDVSDGVCGQGGIRAWCEGRAPGCIRLSDMVKRVER